MRTELKSRLTTATIDLFCMMNEFTKVHNIKKEVTLYLPDDQLQDKNQMHVIFFNFLFIQTYLRLQETVK